MLHPKFFVTATDPVQWTPPTTVAVRLVGVPLCPDLLSLDDIGEADHLRGRVVRGFFRLIRWWKS